MPKLGESVTEGTIARWLKREGDRVEQYDALAEVVTDKVTAEIPADCSGTLQSILIAENETVAVGTLLAVIAEDGASVGEADNAAPRPADGPRASGATLAVGAPDDRRQKLVDASGQTSAAPGAAHGGPSAGRFSPVVSRLAAEHGVDLAQVGGTGIGGRVTRKDVLRHIEQGASRLQPKPVDETSAAAGAIAGHVPAREEPAGSAARPPELAASGREDSRDEWVAVSPLRRTIAKRMVQSKREAPHAWMMVEVDVTGMHRLRERERAAFKAREGVDLTYFPFFLKAVADSLRHHPLLNAVWAEDKILLKRDIHLSIAVATDDALAVPVIHHADHLSVAGLSLATNDLARRARAGKLVMADVEGGTFTVNNTGAFRSILSQPIINSPQAAILSVESIVKRPIIRADDSIAIRHMVNLCLSIDHRVLDGLTAGRFMQAVKERLEAIGEQTSLY